MTLISLRSVPKQERSAVLSSVSSYLLPTHQEIREQPTEIERAVLDELGRKFGYSGLTVPEKKLSAVQRQVFHELSALLASSKPQDVRARIGQQGMLPAILYTIKFGQNFLKLSSPKGITKALAENTITHAEAIQHIFPEEHGISSTYSHSLFVKAHPTVQQCSVLILTLRDHANLMVEGAWLLFHEIIGGIATDQPSVLLEKFACHYGTDFMIGEVKGRFFLSSTIPAKPGGMASLFRFVDKLPGELIETRLSAYQDETGSVRVALAYTVRTHKYLNDLKINGVPFSRNLNESGAPHVFQQILPN